jgi:hypothetical protein
MKIDQKVEFLITFDIEIEDQRPKDAGIPLNRVLKTACPQKNGLVKEAIEF